MAEHKLAAPLDFNLFDSKFKERVVRFSNYFKDSENFKMLCESLI
jgi:hypothetical protein